MIGPGWRFSNFQKNKKKKTNVKVCGKKGGGWLEGRSAGLAVFVCLGPKKKKQKNNGFPPGARGTGGKTSGGLMEVLNRGGNVSKKPR